MEYTSVSNFRSELAALTKKSKDGYSSCPDDIAMELHDKNFNQIWDLGNVLIHSEGIRINKIRIRNSGLQQGKSRSFRLIAILFK